MFNTQIRISDKGDFQFGYYIGRTIKQVPDSYLKWIVSDFEVENEHDIKLVDAVGVELDVREISA